MVPVRYRIGPDGRLTAIDAGWMSFAAENGGAAPLQQAILGRPLWDFISDMTTREIYRSMVDRVRAGGAPIRFRFRCDAPALRRLLAMQITGDADQVLFEVTSAEEQARPPVALLEAGHPRNDEVLTTCSWCSRVLLPTHEWVDMEQAIVVLDLFVGGPLPSLTHGMCPACFAALSEALDDPDSGDEGMVTVGALPPA